MTGSCAAAHYQRIMQTILKPLLYQGCIQYLDDTLLYGRNETELLDRVEQFFTLNQLCKIVLRPKPITKSQLQNSSVVKRHVPP